MHCFKISPSTCASHSVRDDSVTAKIQHSSNGFEVPIFIFTLDSSTQDTDEKKGGPKSGLPVHACQAVNKHTLGLP